MPLDREAPTSPSARDRRAARGHSRAHGRRRAGGHPSKGKIDDVERSADAAKKKGNDDGGSGSSSSAWAVVFDGAGDVFSAFYQTFAWYPRERGRGYLRYPYAETTSPATFVRGDVESGRTFGAVSAAYFRDDESTLRAAHFSVEWAGSWVHRTIEFSSYAEPKPNQTDHLQMFRLSFAGLPAIGDIGYLTIGAGIQVVTVGSDAASGPEVEVGAQLFPLRPFGVAASARVAPLTWNGGPTWGVGFADLAANGSVFVGRFELQAGYRWTRIGVGSPFKGPTLGMKVWF